MFINLSQRTLLHLTRERLQRLTQIAVQDHRCCYKHLIEIIKYKARIIRELEHSNLLYIFSDVLLKMHRMLGAYNRVLLRFLDDIESVLAPFTSYLMVKKLKVLGWWAPKEIFSSEEFHLVSEILLDYSPKPASKRQRIKRKVYDQTLIIKHHCKDYSKSRLLQYLCID